MMTASNYNPLQAQPPTLYMWRCSGCNRILARLYLPPGGAIEIKCKCNVVNTLRTS